MSELVDWLSAQLDADEAAARAATPGPWQTYHSRHDFRDGSFCEAWGVETNDESIEDVGHLVVEIGHDRDYGTPEAACERAEDAAHIARHDPARVLVEVEAKRAIISLHPEMLGWCQGCAHETYPCRTLLALASVFADRPGFDETWRP